MNGKNTSAPATPAPGKTAARKLEKVAEILLPLAVSTILVCWLFSKIDFRTIGEVMKRGCDYRYLLIMMVLTWLAESIRGVRWGIQLRAAGIRRLPVSTEVNSIYGAYALNMLFSYLGEAWRCVYAAKEGNAKLSTVVGTDLGDRISDLIVILLLIVAAFFAARSEVMSFMDHYTFGRRILRTLSSPDFWLLAGAIVLTAVLVLRKCRNEKWMQGVRTSADRIWQGFALLFHMKGIGPYTLLTIAIWVCYFFETYSCFFAFPFTRHLVTDPGNFLGFLPGLVVFVFGSVSMGVPSSGGLGPWNIAVMFALTLFGVSQADAASYSIVVWTAQTLMIVLLGLWTMAVTTIARRFPSHQHPEPVETR